MRFLAILGGIFGIFLASLFNGYALSILWGWFIVPTFKLPVLGVVPAIGVAMVIGHLTRQPQKNEDKNKKFVQVFTEGILTSLFNSAFIILFGWIVHLFM